MDLHMRSQREEIISELKRAIKNINRNLYEWRDKKAGKTNFSISMMEVHSLTRNWIIRCLRSIMEASVIDRIFGSGHLYFTVDDNNLCIKSIGVHSHEHYRTYYHQSQIISKILQELDYESLRYDPADYAPDGVSQRDDEFYYKPFEPSSSNFLDEFKFETPKD